jgi:protein-S-isoprenylcysteine O-methyltransferase Ste14
MSKTLSHIRSRVAVSRVIAVAVAVVALFTASKWQKYPLFGETLFAAGCVLVGIASVGRLWCALYISGYKKQSLITAGPYSLCRNPLYFFSLLGATGVGLATETIMIPLIIGIAFALYYPAIIKAEEVKLRGLHSERYEVYCNTVPRFIPRLSLLKEPTEYLVNTRIFRKSMLDALWFVWLVGIVEIVRALQGLGLLPVYWNSY